MNIQVKLNFSVESLRVKNIQIVFSMKKSFFLLLILIVTSSFSNKLVFFTITQEAILYQLRTALQNDSIKFNEIKCLTFSISNHPVAKSKKNKKKIGSSLYNLGFDSSRNLDTLRYTYVVAREMKLLDKNPYLKACSVYKNELDDLYYTTYCTISLEDTIRVQDIQTFKTTTQSINEILKNEPESNM